MISGTRTLLCLVATLLLAAAIPARAADDKDSVKERLEKRYPTLLRLENEGKLGEMYSGFTGAVKAEYMDLKVDPSDPNSVTVRTFLSMENRDRLLLYEMVAEGRDISAAEVGVLNGKKIFKSAAPDHFLRPAGRDWIRKKDLEAER